MLRIPTRPRCFSYLCLAWNVSSVPDRENSSTTACYNSWDCVEGMVCLKVGFLVSLAKRLVQFNLCFIIVTSKKQLKILAKVLLKLIS